MKSAFKGTINWNKYQSKVTKQAQNQHLDCLIDPHIQSVYRPLLYRLKIMQLEQHTQDIFFRKWNERLERYNRRKKRFWSASKNDLGTYDNIQEILTSWGDDCTTGLFLDYLYFKKYYAVIVIDLNKQQAFDADTKAIQLIHFA